MRKLLVLVVLLMCTLPFGVARVYAQNPLITLDSARSGYSLSGNWQFLPGDDMGWASPDFEDAHWGTMSVPGRWPAPGYPQTGQIAWYRLTLQFDIRSPSQRAELDKLGVAIGKVMSAYELYAGGILLGGVGRMPPLGEVNFDRWAVYPIPSSAVDEDGSLVLAMRVWGGSDVAARNFGVGAYEGDFRLGDHAELVKADVVAAVPSLVMSVLFASFGLYYLYLYRRNRQLRSNFWFGLMAIDVAIYALMLSQWKYLLSWSFVTFEKIEYGAIYLFPALAIQLLCCILSKSVSPVLRIYQIGFMLAAAVVVLAPGLEMHYRSLHIWQVYTLPLLAYGPWLIIKEARAGNAEARTTLVGLLVFVATCINDLSLDLLNVHTTRLLPYGFVAVMISMAVSLANRLTSVLDNLESEVAERTADLSALNSQLADAARRDSMTGLFNRLGFTEKAEAEIQRVSRSERDFSIILADIDKFKQFNDLHGHACGDHVLKGVAEKLSQRLRDIDTVARWGGEEFIFLLPETDAPGAASLAEKLRDSLEACPFEFEGNQMKVTLTFGVASHRRGESLDSCIARADTALYHGKERGRNRVMIGSYRGLTLVS